MLILFTTQTSDSAPVSRPSIGRSRSKSEQFQQYQDWGGGDSTPTSYWTLIPGSDRLITGIVYVPWSSCMQSIGQLTRIALSEHTINVYFPCMLSSTPHIQDTTPSQLKWDFANICIPPPPPPPSLIHPTPFLSNHIDSVPHTLISIPWHHTTHRH